MEAAAIAGSGSHSYAGNKTRLEQFLTKGIVIGSSVAAFKRPILVGPIQCKSRSRMPVCQAHLHDYNRHFYPFLLSNRRTFDTTNLSGTMEAAAIACSGSHAYTCNEKFPTKGIVIGSSVVAFMRPNHAYTCNEKFPTKGIVIGSSVVAFTRPRPILVEPIRRSRMPICHVHLHDYNLDFYPFQLPDHKHSRLGIHLFVIGVGDQCSNSKALEKLAISYSRMPDVVGELSSLRNVGEVAVLSTCDRFEIYAIGITPHIAVRELTAWMAEKSGIPFDKFHEYSFLYLGQDASRHLFEMTAGGTINLERVRKTAKCLGGFEGFGRIMKTLFEHAISVGEHNKMKGGGKAEPNYIDEEIDEFESWFKSVGVVYILHMIRRVFQCDFGVSLPDDILKNYTIKLKNVLGNDFNKLMDGYRYQRFDDGDDNEEECQVRN